MFGKFDRIMDAKELEHIMAGLDITKKTMARALGITVPSIDHYLMGRRPIPLHIIKVLRYWVKNPDSVDDFLALCPEIEDLSAH